MMFVQKRVAVCLLAALAVQIYSAAANPIKTTSKDEIAAETEVHQLETRGMFDFVPNPTSMLSSSVKAVDDNLRAARSLGTKAVRNTVGSGMELATGVNPVSLVDMPNELMKKAVRGARYGTDVAYDAADKTIDTIQNLHDKKKQLVDDYVKPVAPNMVNDAIDRINDGFDSTMGTIKDGVKIGRTRVSEALSNLEERLERGEPILPASLTQGIENAGNALGGASSWIGGWGIPGSAPSMPDAVNPDAAAAAAAADTAATEAAAAAAAEAEASAKKIQEQVPVPVKAPVQNTARPLRAANQGARPTRNAAGQVSQAARRATRPGGRSSSWLS